MSDLQTFHRASLVITEARGLTVYFLARSNGQYSITVEKSACSTPSVAMRVNRVVPTKTKAAAKNEISIFMDLSPLSDYEHGKACAKASSRVKHANKYRRSGSYRLRWFKLLEE
jgi:hypothetical protein